ncbi:MAG: ABC-type transport auxiliary lipoprotein family protein [Sphingomonadales bacterium]
MRYAVLMALLTLAGCGPLVQVGGNAPPPTALLLLPANVEAPAPARLAGAGTMAVALPQVPATLQTLRLAVRVDATQVQYLPRASWAEQPNRLFRRLLADHIAAAGQPVLPAGSTVVPGRVLAGTLRDFGLDVRGASQVVVRFDAELTDPLGKGQVALKSFTASEPVSSQTPEAVAAALAKAANRLGAELAGWVKGQ